MAFLVVLRALSVAWALLGAVEVRGTSLTEAGALGGGATAPCPPWPCRCSPLMLQCVGRDLSFAILPRGRGAWRRVTVRGCRKECGPLPRDAWPDAWHLDVSGNALHTLSLGDVAAGVPLVRELRAEHCALARLTPPPANGTVLKHLSALYLAGNRLASLSALAFARMPALRLLDVRGSPVLVPQHAPLLVLLGTGATSSLPLQVLRLEGARGPLVLGPSTVCHLRELRALQLDACGVRRVQEGGVRCLLRLRRLSLRGNALRQLLTHDPRHNSRAPVAGAVAGDLGELLLEGNPLTALDAAALDSRFPWRRKKPPSNPPNAADPRLLARRRRRHKAAPAVAEWTLHAVGCFDSDPPWGPWQQRQRPSSSSHQQPVWSLQAPTATQVVLDVSFTPFACDLHTARAPKTLRKWAQSSRAILRASCPEWGGVAHLWGSDANVSAAAPPPPPGLALGAAQGRGGAWGALEASVVVVGLALAAWLWLILMAATLLGRRRHDAPPRKTSVAMAQRRKRL